MQVDDLEALTSSLRDLRGRLLEHLRDGSTGGTRDQQLRGALVQDECGVGRLLVDGLPVGCGRAVRPEREAAVSRPLQRREQGGPLSTAADEAHDDGVRRRPAQHEAEGRGEIAAIPMAIAMTTRAFRYGGRARVFSWPTAGRTEPGPLCAGAWGRRRMPFPLLPARRPGHRSGTVRDSHWPTAR